MSTAACRRATSRWPERRLAAAEALVDPSELGELEQLELLKTRLARMKGQGDRAVFHA